MCVCALSGGIPGVSLVLYCSIILPGSEAGAASGDLPR